MASPPPIAAIIGRGSGVEFDTVIAIDWSGSQKESDQRKKIWACTARVEGGSAVIEALECGRSRDQVADWLASLRAERGSIAVGLDFAFSFPAGFHGHEGVAEPLSGKSWAEFLDYADNHADEILASCPTPFWGHTGRKRPDDETFGRFSDGQRLRVTDRMLGERSNRPKEIFQIGGAGSVGTGSLRGMQILSKLRSSGWSVWPFDEPTDTTLIEIYPGCLYRWKVNKTDVLDRERYLKKLEGSMAEGITVPDRWLWARAMASDDSFDAFVSCLAMAQAELDGGLLFSHQEHVTSEVAVEGWIWGGESWQDQPG